MPPPALIWVSQSPIRQVATTLGPIGGQPATHIEKSLKISIESLRGAEVAVAAKGRRIIHRYNCLVVVTQR